MRNKESVYASVAVAAIGITGLVAPAVDAKRHTKRHTAQKQEQAKDSGKRHTKRHTRA